MSFSPASARSALRTATVSAVAATLLMTGAAFASASAHPVPPGGPQYGSQPYEPHATGGGSGAFQTPFGYISGGMQGSF